MKTIDFNSPFMQFLFRCSDLIILNVLWFLCCLPVVTAGAATTALYRCTLNMYSEDAPSGAKHFFHAFKRNFKQATILFFIQCFGFILLGVDIWCCLYNSGEISFVIRIVSLVSAILVLGVGFYLYPLQAQFDNSIKRTLCNAVYLTFSHFPVTLLALAIDAIPIILLLTNLEFFLRTSLFWIVGGVSLMVFINTFFLKRVFDRYINSEQTSKNDA